MQAELIYGGQKVRAALDRGVSVTVEQLAEAPVATLPEKLPKANGRDSGAPTPK